MQYGRPYLLRKLNKICPELAVFLYLIITKIMMSISHDTLQFSLFWVKLLSFFYFKQKQFNLRHILFADVYIYIFFLILGTFKSLKLWLREGLSLLLFESLRLIGYIKRYMKPNFPELVDLRSGKPGCWCFRYSVGWYNSCFYLIGKISLSCLS